MVLSKFPETIVQYRTSGREHATNPDGETVFRASVNHTQCTDIRCVRRTIAASRVDRGERCISWHITTAKMTRTATVMYIKLTLSCYLSPAGGGYHGTHILVCGRRRGIVGWTHQPRSYLTMRTVTLMRNATQKTIVQAKLISYHEHFDI